MTTSAWTSRQFYRLTRPCFCLPATSVRAPILPPHDLDGTPPFRMPGHDLNASTLDLSHFGSFFALRKRSKFRADKPATAASTGRRSGHSGTHLGATGGTQTHSRRTGSKLGQLHYARQGLVRVPESNTKYGGNRGKPRGHQTSPMPPSISESSGIPKRKKLFGMGLFALRPAVHRATIYCG